MRHCGNCEYCTDGAENHCEAYKHGFIGMTRGTAFDGGLATYLLCPAAEVISIGEQDPAKFAPLIDVDVTAYHAVQTVIQRLRPGSSTAIIGIGGLGCYGIQIVNLLSEARIYAIDISARRLVTAASLGVDDCIRSNDSVVEKILTSTNGRGVDTIIHFVGGDQTLLIATRISRPRGRIVVVRLGDWTVRLSWTLFGTSCKFAFSLESTRQDLKVCDLTSRGTFEDRYPAVPIRGYTEIV